jgi:hypothetical protein
VLSLINVADADSFCCGKGLRRGMSRHWNYEVVSEGALTLGEAIWRPVLACYHVRNAGLQADLGGDQGRKTALLDEAHLDG